MIAGLTEEIKELRSEKNRIFAHARCTNDEDMKVFSAKLDQSKRYFNNLIERKTALTADRQDGIAQYEDAYERIQSGGEKDVEEERRRLRAENESRLTEIISEIYGDRFDPKLLSDAAKETDYGLIMDKRVEDHRKTLYRKQKGRIHQLPLDHGSR